MSVSPPTSRRRALAVLVRAGASCMAAGSAMLSACASLLGRSGGRRVAVGRLDALPDGAGRRASLGGDETAIVVNVAGQVRAFRAVCTHEGCPLGWNAQQHLIRCPCHGGAYDTNGRVVSGPPPAPLTELRAVVERGEIYVISTPGA